MVDISGNRLAELTGKAWRTCKRRLEAAGIPSHREGNADLYDSAAALEAIYAPDAAGGELDPMFERARRDKESADALAIKNAVARREVAHISVMEEEVAALISDMRTNALGMGAKLAPTLVGLTAAQVQHKIDNAIYELLTEIANYRPGRAKA